MEITAKFVGSDSLGYVNGVTYRLTLSNSGLTIKRVDGSGKCDYESTMAFIRNWTDITEFKEVTKENDSPLILTTIDGYKIFDTKLTHVYSCMLRPPTGDQILNIYDLSRHQIKKDRAYFKNIEKCMEYLNRNSPLFNMEDLINLGISEKLALGLTIKKINNE